MIPKRWVTRKLQKGDLRALADIRRGNGASPDKIGRLALRKFVRVPMNGRAKVTMRGRLALLVRRLTDKR